MATPTRSAKLHRSIWYMGAKTRILPGFLDEVLEEELDPGSTVVDLMSGSGVVSAFCAQRHRVIANDVQRYASLIARSLIEHDPATRDSFLSAVDPSAHLDDAFGRHFDRLAEHFEPALAAEEKHLAELRAGRDSETWASRYRHYLSRAGELGPGLKIPARARLFRGAQELYDHAARLSREDANAASPDACLATTYYQNIYFGLRQAIEIDALRAAIEEIDPATPFAESLRLHYLSALLHAASVSTSGTSHFAQPRHLTKDSELRAMGRRRLVSIRDALGEHSASILATVREGVAIPGNRGFCGDYRERLDEGGAFDFGLPVDLVYIDPPYTADNYSRFYHVLEVLARYDYPELERDSAGVILRGRYPVLKKRFRSGFCSAARVESEFRAVARATARSGAKLVVSYASPTGLLLKTWAKEGPGDPLDRLRDLFRESFRKVKILSRSLLHSGQGDSNLAVDELLVVASRPR